jgi:hypothetical protein
MGILLEFIALLGTLESATYVSLELLVTTPTILAEASLGLAAAGCFLIVVFFSSGAVVPSL